MEVIAFVNGVIQIGVIYAAVTLVRSPVQRNVLVALAGAALLASVVGLLWLVLGDAGMAALATWVLYGAIGLAVAAGVIGGLRNGRTRFAWPQGRYHKYRSYRRI